MSFFRKRSFRSGSTPKAARKSIQPKAEEDDGEDSDWASSPIALKLGNCSLTYDNGKWKGELVGDEKQKEQTAGEDVADSSAQQEYIRKLEEENRLLKFKIEVLIDMVKFLKANKQTKKEWDRTKEKDKIEKEER
eukprot:m.133483 g.133483  ORF g.133483 m.133483 type:complete len:135 (+) comp15801_c1_seq2:115-519(+)